MPEMSLPCTHAPLAAQCTVMLALLAFVQSTLGCKCAGRGQHGHGTGRRPGGA